MTHARLCAFPSLSPSTPMLPQAEEAAAQDAARRELMAVQLTVEDKIMQVGACDLTA